MRYDGPIYIAPGRPNRHDWRRHRLAGYTATHCLFCKSDFWITVPVEVYSVARHLHGQLEPGENGFILRVTQADEAPFVVVTCGECNESYYITIEDWYFDPEAQVGAIED